MAELTQARPVVIAGRNSPWFRWLAVFLGLVLGLTAAEATLREIAPPSDTKAIAFPGSPRQYGYPANFVGYAGGVRFMTNSSGFRGREFSEASPAKDFSVVVVGDSYAFGYGVEYANSFPAIIERELSSSGRPVKVFDLAMPGYNTAEELATLQEFAPHLHPDLILLSYHPNDIERHAASNENSGETILQSLNLREHLYLARFSAAAACGRCPLAPYPHQLDSHGGDCRLSGEQGIVATESGDPGPVHRPHQSPACQAGGGGCSLFCCLG